MEATVSSPAPSSAPPPSAPSSAPSSSSASTPAASPTATTTQPTKSTATSARELGREYAKRAAEKLLADEQPAATEGETSEATATTEEVASPETPQRAETEAKTEAKEEAAEPNAPGDPQSVKIGEALKAIQDPKVRNEIRGLAYAGKEFRDLKFTPAEAKEYRGMFGSVEVAKQANESAKVAYDVAQAFHSGSNEGFEYVLNNFHNANPAAFQRMVEHIASRLPQAAKPAYDGLARRATTSVINNLNREAEAAARRGDDGRAHEYATTATILSEFVFPNGVPQGRPAQPRNDRVTQELQQLRNEKAQWGEMQRQGLIQNVTNGYNEAVSKEALSVVKQATDGTPYPAKAIEKMANEVANRVRNRVTSNDHVRMAVVNHVNNGNGRAAQDYLTQTAQQYIAAEAADVLRDYAEQFDAFQSSRTKTQEAAVAKKDVGGAPSAGQPANKPIDTRGKSNKQLFKDALRARGLNL